MQNVPIVSFLHVFMQMFHIDSKLQSLSAKLTTDLNSKCRCDFNSQYIVFNQSLCLPNQSDWFVISGVMVGTNTFNSTDIIELLQMWAKAQSHVRFEGILLTAVKDCSVYLEEGEAVSCERLPEPSASLSSTPVQGTSTPVQGPSTPVQGTSTPVQETSIPVQENTHLFTIIIFAAIVFVLVLVLVGVLCTVTVTVLRRKAHSRHLRYVYPQW